MIRRANNNEFKILTEISFESKGYWNYPREYIKIWEKELTITKEYINQNAVSFYEKMGCSYIEDYPSTIAGRTIPFLKYYIENRS